MAFDPVKRLADLKVEVKEYTIAGLKAGINDLHGKDRTDFGNNALNALEKELNRRNNDGINT